MPLEGFRVQGTPDDTLKIWARQLNWLFKNLDTVNVTIGTDDIKDYMIDFGTGLQQVDALDIPIVDSTGYYSSTSVEGALEEVSRALLNNPAANMSIVDSTNYYTSTNVEGALEEVARVLRNMPAVNVSIADSTGAYSSTSAEGAFEEISRLIRSSSGDTVVDSTGNIVLESTNVLWRNAVWDDLRVSMTDTKGAGVKDPGFIKVLDNGTGSPGVYAYGFDPLIQEELFFACQIPHTYKQDTDITAHVHWVPTTTNSGDVVWGLEYTWSNVNDTFGNTAILTVTDAADLIIGKHQAVALNTITGTGKRESSMLLCRIFRDSTVAADTYPDDAALLEIDFHFLNEKLGTITPTYATT